jgi:hypothetical protein
MPTILRRRSQKKWGPSSFARNRRFKRQFALESLESRTLLSYTFVYTNVNTVTVNEAGGSDSFIIRNDGAGLLVFSTDGGSTFSPDWGAPGNIVDASAATTVTTHITGDNSAFQLGFGSSPASANLAAFVLTLLGNTANTVTIDDSASLAASTYTVDTGKGPNFPITGPGINFQEPTGISSGGITLKGSSGVDTYNVLSTFGGEPVTIDAGASSGNFVNVGSDPGTPSNSTLGNIHSLVTVHDFPGFATLNVLDAGDTSSADAFIDGGTISGMGFGTGGSISYSGGNAGGVTPVIVDGGTNGAAGITYTVAGTTSPTTLNCGPNADTVNVLATGFNAPLFIHGDGGRDAVNIGNSGSVLGILGSVHIDNGPAHTDITVDASADAGDHNYTLSGADVSTLTGLAPADIIYDTDDAATLTLLTNHAGNQVLNVDFSTGNPIPTFTSIGLILNAGADFGDVLGSHAMNLFGTLPTGPFATEVHNANDPTVFPQIGQYGTIFFTDSGGTGTGLSYTGLLPINDTASAVTYTFNDFADDQSFLAQNGPVVLGFNTVQFVNTPATPPPTFETTNVANKTNIIFNTTTTTAGVNGVVDITTASTGLATLAFNTKTGNDNEVSFQNTPPGVTTSLVGGSDEDVTNVTGQGIAGVPTVTALFLNGGGAASGNTLNYNAGGETPTVTSDGGTGVFISIPGFGRVDAVDYGTINITNIAPIVVTPGPAVSINSIEGFRLVNELVATFTAPLPFPPPPEGLPASDFTATINWGDGTSTTAGTITQDASNPSVYDVTGNHKYVDNGTFTVTTAVSFNGGSITTTIGGVPVTFNFPPAPPPPVALTPGTATVTQGTLAVTAFPIVGTEGLAIAAAPIATFIDAGGADPIGDYTAQIVVVDPLGNTVVNVSAASITQQGTSAEFTVHAPALTLPEAGSYSVRVVVTDTDGSDTVTAAGWSLAVIDDADLTAGPSLTPSGFSGVALTGVGVGTFTDANPTAGTGDFTATVFWGDGTAASAGTVTQPGGVGTAFDVAGSHVYAKPGTYTVTTNVVDDDGETTTLTATFTITDNPINGATENFTAVEGQSTGEFVLATYTDPNTLATVANENAVLAIGGWGDGTPTVAGVRLVVRQIGVTPLTSPTNPGAPIFQVLGSHVYAEETPPGLPDTLSVIITTLGGTTTTLTSPPGGGVTVHDARLTSSNGTEITGTEGIATPTLLLGTFTDANQGATNADFLPLPMPGGNGGSVVVNWGDGSAPETLTAAGITASGSPEGVIFSLTDTHTYAEAGTYAYTVTVTDDGGATTVISGSAIIADATLTASVTQPTVSTTEASRFPVPVFAPPVFKGAVASFTDANPISTTADFTAVIDWGDGTPLTAGTVSQPGGVGTAYVVSGSHTYADSGVNGGAGMFAIQVFIQDDDGSRLTVTNTATVADNPIVLTGNLNPASDSGLSNGIPNTTNVAQPDFIGKSEPFSHVVLFAAALPGGSPVQIGQTQAGSDGSWDIRSGVVLADNHYAITATAVDQFGVTTTTAPVTITANLLIDTTDPVIAGVFFDRLNGRVNYIIKDPVPASGSAPSGVDVPSLEDSSNYLLEKVHPQKNFPGKFIVTNVAVSPDPTLPFAFDVSVTFNNGHILQGGFYLFTIRSASEAGGHGVQDEAENLLDGEFFGSFPTGPGLSGTDFVAELQAVHNKVFAPQTILGTANGANGGAGGAPVGAIHSGSFVPAVPVGGAPIFSTSTSPVTSADPPAPVKHAKHKGQVHVKAKHVISVIAPKSSHVKHASVVTSNNHPRGPLHRK